MQYHYVFLCENQGAIRPSRTAVGSKVHLPGGIDRRIQRSRCEIALAQPATIALLVLVVAALRGPDGEPQDDRKQN